MGIDLWVPQSELEADLIDQARRRYDQLVDPQTSAALRPLVERHARAAYDEATEPAIERASLLQQARAKYDELTPAIGNALGSAASGLGSAIGSAGNALGGAITSTPIGRDLAAGLQSSIQSQQGQDYNASQAATGPAPNAGQLVGPEGMQLPMAETGTPAGEETTSRLARIAAEQTPGGRLAENYLRRQAPVAMTADTPVENVAQIATGALTPLNLAGDIAQQVAEPAMRAIPGGETSVLAGMGVRQDTPVLGGLTTPDIAIPGAAGLLIQGPDEIAGIANRAMGAAGAAGDEGRAGGRAADREYGGAASGIVTDEARRVFHGTDRTFARPDPSKFDPGGLYGAGYYMTDEPRVASSYATQRAAVGEDEIGNVEYFLKNAQQRADRGDPKAAGEVAMYTDELDRLRNGGAQVRPATVPEGTRLLAVDAPADPAEIRAIREAIEPRPDVPDVVKMKLEMAEERVVNGSQRVVGHDVWEALQPNDLPAKQGVAFANRLLEDAGFQGIEYGGGRMVPIRDEAGAPILHTATMIFPRSLDRVRNGLSGAAGGIVSRVGDDLTTADRLAGYTGAAIGAGQQGYQSAQAGEDPDTVARRALTGAAFGAGLGVMGKRSAASLGRVARNAADEFATARRTGITGGLDFFGDLGAAGERVTRPGEGALVDARSTADPTKQYEFRYRLVSLDDLIPSQTDAGGAHPQYPRELQPRDRSRLGSIEQTDRIARSLVPEALLDDSRRLDTGPPIVGDDNLVESGNGRILALRRARQNYPEQFAAYRQELQSRLDDYGINPSEAPPDAVLVRERVTPMTPDERRAFASEANQSAVLQMSPAEVAQGDARLISDQGLAGLQVSEGQSVEEALRAAGNAGFVQDFIGALPVTERASLMTRQGALNKAGLARIRSALFARTYPGEAGQRLTETFTESQQAGVKRIEAGLFASLPTVARAEALVASGQRDADLAIGADLAAAIDVYARLRAQGMKVADYLGQSSLFERELTQPQEMLLAHLETLSRRPTQVRAFLQDYAQRVIDAPPPGQMSLLGDVERPTKEGLLRDAITTQDPRSAERTLALWSRDVPPDAETAIAQAPPGRARLAGADGAPAALPIAGTPGAAEPVRPQRVGPAPTPASNPEQFPSGTGAEQQAGIPGLPPPEPVTPPAVTPPPFRPGTSTSAVPPVSSPGPARGPVPTPPIDAPGRMTDDNGRLLSLARQVEEARTQGRLGPMLEQIARQTPEDQKVLGRFDGMAGTLARANLLWSPLTHIRNLFGNTAAMAWRPLEAVVAPEIEPMLRQQGREIDPRYRGEAGALLSGWAQATGAAWENAIDAWRQGERYGRDLIDASAPRRGATTERFLASPAGQVWTGPFRLLGASDAFFKTLGEGGELSQQAYRAARSELGKGAASIDVQRRMAELMRHPTERMLDAVHQAGLYMTYQQELDGLGKGLQWVGRQAPILLPFVKTPYNVAKYDLERSPIGLWGAGRAVFAQETTREPGRFIGDAARDVTRYTTTSGAAADRVARAGLGTLMFGGMLVYASQGGITGATPTSSVERAAWAAEGRQPWSIKLGDRWVSLAMVPGLNASLATAAVLANAQKTGELRPERGIVTLGTEAALNLAQVLGQRPLAGNLADIVVAINDPATATNLASRLESTAAGMVSPAGSLGRYFVNVFDPNVRETHTFWDRIKASYPGLAQTLPIRRDVFGREMERTQTGLNAALNPFRSSREQQGIRQYIGSESAEQDTAIARAIEATNAYERDRLRNPRPTTEQRRLASRFEGRRNSTAQALVERQNNRERLEAMARTGGRSNR